MAAIYVTLLVVTVGAFALGSASRSSWKISIGLCVVVSLTAWIVRLISIVNGDDVHNAEDYLNSLSPVMTVVEVGTIFGWTSAWYGLGRLARWAFLRIIEATT
jgi:hypothetical protein